MKPPDEEYNVNKSIRILKIFKVFSSKLLSKYYFETILITISKQKCNSNTSQCSTYKQKYIGKIYLRSSYPEEQCFKWYGWYKFARLKL